MQLSVMTRSVYPRSTASLCHQTNVKTKNRARQKGIIFLSASTEEQWHLHAPYIWLHEDISSRQLQVQMWSLPQKKVPNLATYLAARSHSSFLHCVRMLM